MLPPLAATLFKTLDPVESFTAGSMLVIHQGDFPITDRIIEAVFLVSQTCLYGVPLTRVAVSMGSVETSVTYCKK